MQDTIISIMAVLVIIAGCVVGWWIENGPDKGTKKDDVNSGEK